MTEDEKLWRQFEARDRAKNLHAWAVHDHMMGQLSSRQQRRETNTLIFKMVVAVVLVIAAIIITT